MVIMTMSLGGLNSYNVFFMKLNMRHSIFRNLQAQKDIDKVLGHPIEAQVMLRFLLKVLLGIRTLDKVVIKEFQIIKETLGKVLTLGMVLILIKEVAQDATLGVVQAIRSNNIPHESSITLGQVTDNRLQAVKLVIPSWRTPVFCVAPLTID